MSISAVNGSDPVGPSAWVVTSYTNGSGSLGLRSVTLGQISWWGLTL